MADCIDLSLDDIIRKKRAAGGKRKAGGQISNRGGKARQFNVRKRGGGVQPASRARAAKSGVFRGKRDTQTISGNSRRRGSVAARMARGGSRRGSVSTSRLQRKPSVANTTLNRPNANRKKALQSPLKRKRIGGGQTSILARGGVLKSGRQLGTAISLQSRAQKTKRLAALALNSKRRALRMLSQANQQLKQSDVRNTVLTKRRALQLKSRSVLSAGGLRGRAGSAALTLSQRRRAALARTRTAAVPLAGNWRGAAVVVPAPARGRGGRRLNRSMLVPLARQQRGDEGVLGDLLRVQIKNSVGQLPPSSTLLHSELVDSVNGLTFMPSPAAAAVPSLSDTSIHTNRSPLNARIQQEIAAIQARGRSQRIAQLDTTVGCDITVRPTAAGSGRTLNDRFTHDRVVFP